MVRFVPFLPFLMFLTDRTSEADCPVLCFIAVRRVCVTVSMQNDGDGSGAVHAADSLGNTHRRCCYFRFDIILE